MATAFGKMILVPCRLVDESVERRGCGTNPRLFATNAESEFLTWPGELQEDNQLALRTMGVDGTPLEERIFGEGTHLRPSIIQFFRAERVLLEDYTSRTTSCAGGLPPSDSRPTWIGAAPSSTSA